MYCVITGWTGLDGRGLETPPPCPGKPVGGSGKTSSFSSFNPLMASNLWKNHIKGTAQYIGMYMHLPIAFLAVALTLALSSSPVTTRC